VVQSIFWLGSVCCAAAALLPLVFIRQRHFSIKLALWPLLIGVAGITLSTVYAMFQRSDFNLGEFHITQTLALSFHLDSLSGFFLSSSASFLFVP
jgi:hypothetical protein